MRDAEVTDVVADEPAGEPEPAAETSTYEAAEAGTAETSEAAGTDSTLDEGVEGITGADDVADPAEDDDRADAAAGEPEDAEASDEEPGGLELPPAMTQMLFVDIVLVLPSTHPVVVLQEADMPYRELRIPIGGPEGIAIGYAARQVATPRPLTHELMTQLLERFNLSLDVVNITGLSGGMFTAELVVSGPAGQRTLDCRPSDAIALALRQRIAVPIMADPDVLDRAAGAAAGSN